MSNVCVCVCVIAKRPAFWDVALCRPADMDDGFIVYCLQHRCGKKFITLMMKTVRSSEKSVNIFQRTAIFMLLAGKTSYLTNYLIILSKLFMKLTLFFALRIKLRGWSNASTTSTTDPWRDDNRESTIKK